MLLGKVYVCIGLIFTGILLFCMAVLWVQKRFPNKKFDERQKQAQGNASRVSLVSGITYFLVVASILIQQVDKPKWIEPYLLVFFGIMFMIAVDHTYCLLTQAAMPLSEKPMLTIISYGVCGLIQLLYVPLEVERYPLSLVGYGTSGWLHILAGALFIYLSVIHLIQYLRDRRARYE